MEFVDDRRFADARVSGYEHKFGSAGVYNAIERSQQRRNFGGSPIQLFRNEQPIGLVIHAKLELIHAAVGCPLLETAL